MNDQVIQRGDSTAVQTHFTDSTLSLVAAKANVQALQVRLTALKKTIANTAPETRETLLREREEAKVALEAAMATVREAKEQAAAMARTRAFAGLGTPLHEACVALLTPETVTSLEKVAVDGQRGRDERAAARHAAKAAKQVEEVRVKEVAKQASSAGPEIL